MVNRLARYEFSERLADLLGESRRDLRFRVTLMVTGGLVAPGPRGRGSPPATPQYAAQLLIGAMAAPQQAQTIEAIRCYEDLRPAAVAPGGNTPRVLFGPAVARTDAEEPPAAAIGLDGMRLAKRWLSFWNWPVPRRRAPSLPANFLASGSTVVVRLPHCNSAPGGRAAAPSSVTPMAWPRALPRRPGLTPSVVDWSIQGCSTPFSCRSAN
jgi:hypothetical protein